MCGTSDAEAFERLAQMERATRPDGVA
jgi:hypothetical protein